MFITRQNTPRWLIFLIDLFIGVMLGYSCLSAEI